MTARWFEDYQVGDTSELGPLSLGEEDIVQFAVRYDPQPFHIDAEAAAASPFGGLIASGWHTCALMASVLATQYLSPASSLGSPGIDELRFLQPVRPGQVFSVRTTVEEARVSRSKPDRGLVRTRMELVDDTGRVACSMRALNLIARRPAT